MPIQIAKQELFIRFAVFCFCIVFWRSDLNVFSFALLIMAWIIDGGLRKLNEVLQTPLAQALLGLCALLLLGLLWSDALSEGHLKWCRYFALLIFIPFFSVLRKDRLPWALGGLILSYAAILIVGVYESFWLGEQGISIVQMSYLGFSAMLGIGVVVMAGLACTNRAVIWQWLLWVTALLLLYVQFHQGGRVLLLATLFALLLMIYQRYRSTFFKRVGIPLMMLGVTALFAYGNPVFEQRWAHIVKDIEQLQQGDYSSSMGYRLAMWDVGLHGILEHPLTGHGTGMAAQYFDDTIATYKNGRYRHLPEFQKTEHFHNDWIEIGMHIGIPGMLSLLFIYWGWFQMFERNRLVILGSGLIGFVVLAGLTDTVLILKKIPILLLIVTAIVVRWQAEKLDTN